jgi:NTP pyrophosphatase (non-canonical NTP hydrolase)
MAHPVLGPSPSLPEIQTYVREMVQHRNLNDHDVLYEFLMLSEEVGELAKAIRKTAGGKFADDTKRTEVQHEVADVFLILVGLCNMLDIDIEQALRDKEEINKQRVWK